MISSKNITLISVMLVALAVAGVVCLMLLPNELFGVNKTGVVEYSAGHKIAYGEDDYYSNYSENAISKIELNGSGAVCKGKNVTAEGNTVTILGGGTYVMSGELSGSVIVDSSDGAAVRLILNGVTLAASDFSALYVKQAEKVIISTVEGTENFLTDSSAYSEDKLQGENATAALYSKDDLTLNGKGTLTVSGNYQDGIKVNDTLKITEGNLKVSAADDGINVNDAIGILEAKIEINSGGDALKCENEDSAKGFIALEGTQLNIAADGDGVYSSSAIYATNVISDIITGGGAESVQLMSGGFGGGFGGGRGARFANNTADTVSTKAFKAQENLVLNGGEYNLDCADDALHSDGDMSLSGGSFNISCGDDALHAEKNITLAPDKLNITKCNEGIEGAYIVIDSGDISIISADDGINAVGENSSSGMGFPMMHKENIAQEDIYLTINGGNIRIETGGDGVDSNGAVKIDGGVVEVYGPENNGNSSLDFQYSLLINGGKLLAVGSSGMAETPSESSEQNAMVFYLEESIDKNAEIVIKDSAGNEIISGTSPKMFNWVGVSTEEINQGEEYTLVINGETKTTVVAEGKITTSGSNGRGRW